MVNSAEFDDPGDSCNSNEFDDFGKSGDSVEFCENGWSSDYGTFGNFCESYALGESVKSVDSWEPTDYEDFVIT